MKIEKLVIKKFRAINSCSLEVGQICAIVGQNGSGKSSVLRALNCFFNLDHEIDNFVSGSHSYSSSATSEIAIWFSDVPTELSNYSDNNGMVGIRMRYKKRPAWSIRNLKDWEPAGDNLIDIIDREVNYTYVPVDRSYEQAEWYEGGLLDLVVSEEIAKHVQRDRVTPKIKEAAEHLRARSLDPLAANLRNSTLLAGDFNFSFEYSEDPDYRMLLNNLAISVEENGKILPLSDTGSGTQSLTVFALYNYLSQINGKDYIIGFEEPEQNLHPQAQVNLIEELRDSGLQVLFTTHSPLIIDELNHEEVALCRKSESNARAFETKVRQIPSSFFSDRGLDRDKYYKFHRRRNSEFFFSNFVAVFESPIDVAVTEQIMEDSGVTLRRSGVNMVSVDGKSSMPYMYHLLRCLEIDCIAVVDKDYFFDFRNQKRADSLNSKGYPVYAEEWHLDGILDASDIEATISERLKNDLIHNHSASIEPLEKHDIYCFKTDMECDLVGCRDIRNNLAKIIGISGVPDNDLEKTLLVDYKNAIKKQENLVPAVSGVSARSLPRTFQAIRRRLIGVANSYL